jgi:hypothetical protein
MAGQGKKTFVAGEVLLAQDVNDYLMDQSVMNFASSAARSSAIPTPTEGMTTYVQDRNQIETFDGTEYRGMSGLQLVKKQTVGSAVASVNVTSAFSATYENYKIVYTGGVGSAAATLLLKMGATTTGYYSNLLFNDNNVATPQGAIRSNTVAGFDWVGGADTNQTALSVDLINPFATKNTYVNNFYNLFTGATYRYGNNGGFLLNNTSYTDFTIVTTSGTLTGGTIYVYGYGT